MMCVQEAPAGTDGPSPTGTSTSSSCRRTAAATASRCGASVETALGVFINDTVPEESAARLAGVEVPPIAWGDIAVPAIEDAG